MSRAELTGTRIRERRVMQGAKQTDLAREIGISASYLNLIEHNRRRIGGKLLMDIAHALNVEAHLLTDGAEAGLLGVLGDAARGADLSAQDAAQAEVFAGRFPAWAAALAVSQRRLGELERTVETLSDRMSHDPHLAEAMHELLTNAAAVRSTAEILAGSETLEPEWQDRFHANLDADSTRLAQTAQALARYLEQGKQAPQVREQLSPQQEAEAFLARYDYRFATLENSGDDTPEAFVERAGSTLSRSAQFILHGVLRQYREDAAQVGLIDIEAAVAQTGPDPLSLARHFDAPVPRVLRRLASLPALGAGLVVCDRAGAVIQRKPVDGFSVPRFDSCCPLWPVFGAFGAMGTTLRRRIGQQGKAQPQFDAYATAEAPVSPGYNVPGPARAVMLLLPVPAGDVALPLDDVGASCRICPHAGCAARREPSILGTPAL